MRRFLLLPALLLGGAISAQPVAPTPARIAELRTAAPGGPPRAAAATPLQVNVASREEVRQFYRAIYNASEGAAMNWAGSYASGAPGDTAAAFKEATLLRINFFRALVGIPASVTFNPTYSAKAQQAALMMSANQTLNHFPPASWTFYTAAGAEAAASSNLALGSAGADAITGYMNDNGTNNAAVGHRRWLIYPQAREMGTGDVPGNGATLQEANATWVFDGLFGTARPVTRTTAVPYPPAGFVPYTLVWPRWSFSYPGADFSNTTVTMTRNGQNVATLREPLSTGVGEPTLVWVYDGLDADAGAAHSRPSADTVYTVALNNVQVSGVAQNFSYSVTVFDPDVAGTDFAPVTVTGSATPVVGAANTYTAAKPDFAGTFEWRSLPLTTFAKTYGAESGLDGITAATAADYSVVQTGVAGAGTASYHLAHSTFASQTLTLPESFAVTGSGAAVTFLSRLGFATAGQVARVQVSADDGQSWSDIYTQAGSGGSGEGGFVSRSASLAAYANRTLRVRLTYTVTASVSYFPQTSSGIGWYVDNLTLAGVQTVTPGAATPVSSGTTFSFTPAAAGTVGLQARGVLFGAYPLEWGPVAQVTATAAANPPTVTTQPSNQTAGVGGAASFSAAASGNPTFQWRQNGTAIAGATNSTFTVTNVQPANAGIYTAMVTSSGGTTTSQAAILGVSSATKLVGLGTEFPDITASNGNVYDQILLSDTAASVTADPGQILRISYIDLNDDIVQVEFSGAGTLTLVLDNPTGPAAPLKYNQAVNYMKGHASIILTGANVTTNVSVFSVGTAVNGNPALYKSGVTYDGFADLAFIAISSTDGKFGGLRAANATLFATKGYTGVYAPGVEFTGPLFVSDINASNDATPVFRPGSAGDVRITGGDLAQANTRAVQVSGITQLKFTAGSDSHGNLFTAKRNQGLLEQDGVNVTAQIVVNPTP